MENPGPIPALPKRIVTKLRALEKMLRFCAVADGLATVFLAVPLLLLFHFCLDRFFEFPVWVRLLFLPALIFAIAFLFGTRLIGPFLMRFRSDQLASIFERYIPGLGESLLTIVELHQSGPETNPEPSEGPNRTLLDSMVHHAVRSLHGIRVSSFFRLGPLVVRLLFSILFLAGFVGCIVSFSSSSELWFSRNILLSDREWPRQSRLVIDGFVNGHVRIGRGDSFTLTVKADSTMPRVPDRIELLLGSKESGYRRVLIDQFQKERNSEGSWRVFSYTFAELLESLPLSIRGADSTLDGLTIEVVPRPMLIDAQLKQHPPAYLKRTDRTLKPGTRTSIADGTEVTFSATSNKALSQVFVSINDHSPEELPLAQPTQWELTLTPRREDTRLEFSLLDQDGLRNRQPIRFELNVVKDQAPVISAQLEGIGSVVTPIAILPTRGEITDDHGLSGACYRYFVESAPASPSPASDPSAEDQPDQAMPNDPPIQKSGTIPVEGISEGTTVFSLNQTAALTPLGLVPGDKLVLGLEASDLYDLDSTSSDSAARVGLGPRWALEVVTPQQLQSILELREISLRQRFETLIEDVRKTKTLADSLDLEPSAELIQEVDAMVLPSGHLTDEEDENRHAKLEAEKQRRLDTLSPDQVASGLHLQSRILRDLQKESYELRALTESFSLIRREMINNRIFSDQAKERLDEGIIEPIRNLFESDFPKTDQLARLLAEILETRDLPMRKEANSQKTVLSEQIELLIQKMQSIRNNMISMESFGETIEMLRAILRQQQELRQETIEQKNRRLKNLLN